MFMEFCASFNSRNICLLYTSDLVAKIAQLPGIEIEGIFTHFAQADEYDKTPTKKQIALFQKMIRMLEERNVKIPIHHCSNSDGIVEIPEANMDMVRAGITLYGMWPSEEVAHNISCLLYTSIPEPFSL